MLLDTTNNLNDIFKILFNNSPLLINCFNNMGKCILWNKSCEKLFGYNLDELNKYSNPLSLFYPDQKQLLLVESEINNPDGVFKIYNVQTKNKTFMSCMFANFKLPDNTTLGLGYDVTKIVDLEDELNYNIKLLKSILDTQNDAILRITKDNISIYCNEKYKQTFCINTKLKDLIFEEDIEIYRVAETVDFSLNNFFYCKINDTNNYSIGNISWGNIVPSWQSNLWEFRLGAGRGKSIPWRGRFAYFASCAGESSVRSVSSSLASLVIRGPSPLAFSCWTSTDQFPIPFVFFLRCRHGAYLCRHLQLRGHRPTSVWHFGARSRGDTN
jgi:PAS domain-containing protein